MKRSFTLLALVAVLVVAGPAFAQVKDLALIDTRTGPPNFTPLGGDHCDSPNLPIPDNDPVGVDTSFNIASGDTIAGLAVDIQATHTWVGDMRFIVTHDDTGTSATPYDQPGVPASTFGCAGADVDVSLADAFAPPVEDVCLDPEVPAIAGELGPSPDALAIFDGESLGGDWTINASDNAGGDTGTLNTWCLSNNVGGDGGDGGGPGTPATSTWGVIALIALFMTVSLFYLRRRGNASA